MTVEGNIALGLKKVLLKECVCRKHHCITKYKTIQGSSEVRKQDLQHREATWCCGEGLGSGQIHHDVRPLSCL